MIAIDLGKFTSCGVRVLSGRDKGEAVRRELQLDRVEQNGDEICIEIPGTILHVNSSFFLGLFGHSVEKLGRENFRRVYKVSAAPRIADRFNEAVDRALIRTGPLP